MSRAEVLVHVLPRDRGVGRASQRHDLPEEDAEGPA